MDSEERRLEDGTRNRILAMATRLARRPETTDFTLEQLADRLELHYTAIYHYFDGRDDLTLALIEAICERRLALLAEAQAGNDSALAQLCDFIGRELREAPTAVPQRAAALLEEPFRSRAAVMEEAVDERLTAHLERGVADGSIETHSPAATALIIRRLLNRYRNRGEQLLRGQRSAHLAEVMIDIVCHGIAVDASAFEASVAIRPRPFPAATSPPPGLDLVVRPLIAEINLRGYEGTSIPRVARSVGVSKTKFYKYGASKEELLYLCAHHTMNLIAQVRQISKVITEDPVEQLLYNLYYSRCLRTLEPGPTLTTAHFNSLAQQHRLVIWEAFRGWRDDLVSLIERGAASGQIRPLEPMLMLPLMSICSSQPIDMEPVEAGFGDEIARFLYRGLASQRGNQH
jgi:AcrR family transcriptional regulator